MARLTITLSDERQKALKETAARCGKTIRELIEESLDAYGVKSASRAAELVAQARKRSKLSPDEALELAVAETRKERKR